LTRAPIERIFSEFRRRTKTQGAFPTPEAMVIVVWGTLATGGIRMRKLHGYKTMEHTPLRQAA
jgi:transposase-like protein